MRLNRLLAVRLRLAGLFDGLPRVRVKFVVGREGLAGVGIEFVLGERLDVGLGFIEAWSTSSSMPLRPFLNSTIPLPRLRPTSGRRLPNRIRPNAASTSIIPIEGM